MHFLCLPIRSNPTRPLPPQMRQTFKHPDEKKSPYSSAHSSEFSLSKPVTQKRIDHAGDKAVGYRWLADALHTRAQALFMHKSGDSNAGNEMSKAKTFLERAKRYFK
jgi:hypothetical protein